MVRVCTCLLYTSDAADERSSVDLGGRRIIKKKNKKKHRSRLAIKNNTGELHSNESAAKSSRGGMR